MVCEGMAAGDLFTYQLSSQPHTVYDIIRPAACFCGRAAEAGRVSEAEGVSRADGETEGEHIFE